MTTSSRRFQDRVAVVTGASRGIGLAVAQRIVEEGGRVCVTGRKPEGLAAALETLGGPDVAMTVAGSADDTEHQQQTMAAVLERFGRVDVLVNNTGVNPTYGPVLQADPSALRKILEVNVLGAVSWTRTAHTAWLGEHGGAVVNISSVAGLLPAGGIGFYGTSKAALIHLTQQLAVELAPGIRVNAVAPAVVKTRFAGALYEGREEQVAAAYPLGRLGTPEDIATAVAFLASDDASWVTGQTLVVDGGLTLAGGI